MAQTGFIPHPGKQSEFLASLADNILFGGARGGAHLLSSNILTPFGFKKMADMRIGSQVNNPDGSISKVINIIPRGKMRTYKFKFVDGAETTVSGDHLWLAHKTSTKYKANRQYILFEGKSEKIKGKLYTTEQLLEEFKKDYCNLLIPLTEPVHFTKSYKYNVRTVDPYVLGVLLGDGCLRHNGISLTSADIQVVDNVRQKINGKVNKRKAKYTYGIIDKELKTNLTRLGVYDKTAIDKFVPECYLYASIEDRIELIRGLFDTDGTADFRGHISFTSISEQLAKDIQWLIRSLGGKATINRHKAGYKLDGEYIECNDAYTVYIQTKFNRKLFTIDRKINRCSNDFNGGVSTLSRRIIDIQEVGVEECQCITVDNPNGLYVCDDFIVTHNSKSFSLCYKAAFQPKKYHWTYRGKKLNDAEYLEHTALGHKLVPVVEKIAIDYPEYVGILIRRTHPQLERNLRPETEKLYKPQGAKWQEKHRRYVFPSGAMIYLVHCKDKRALDDYIGGNYHFIGFDEVNQFPKEWVDAIVTSNRTTNPELKPQVCLTSNPGNIGHVWLKRTYVDRCQPVPTKPIYNKEFDITYTLMESGEPFIDENGVSWQYIPSLVFENPSLMLNDPAYVKRLKNLNKTLQEMWLFGNWGAFAGMFFDKWDENTHTIDEKQFRWKKEFSKETHSLYRFYDYGTKAPFVCLFVAVDVNGKMVVFDEIVETGLASTAQAKLVNEYTLKTYGLKPDDFDGEICDPQYMARTSEKDNMPYSPSEHYGDENIHLSQGVRDRKVGAKIIYDALDPLEDDVPRIRFRSNCIYCIETIPALPSAENDPEDVDTDGEDHAYDALKYGGSLILPGLFTVPTKKRGWRNEMARKYANSDINEQISGSWLSV